MRVGFVVLLALGLILMTANNSIKGVAASGNGNNVVYKYLPRDIDDVYRDEDNQASLLYRDMFVNENV